MSKSETRIYDIIAQGENMENVFHEETEISIGPQNIEEGNPELTSNGECAHVVPSLKEKDDNSMSTKKDCHPESKDGTFVKDYTVIANSVYVDKGDLEPGGIILEPISDDSLSLEDISEDEEGQIEIKDQPFAHSTLLLRNNEVESKRTELLPNRGTDINTPLPANVEKDLKMESIRNGDDDYAKFSAIPEDICIEENQGNVVEGESTVLEDDPGSFCNILDRRHGDFASEEVEETASPLSVRNPPHSENAEEDVSASQVLSEQDDKSLLEDPGEDNVIDRRTSPVNASSDIFSVDVQQMSPDGHSKTIEPCEKLPMEDVVSEEKSPGIIPMAQSQDSEDNKEVTSQGLVADHGNSILGTALESKNEVRVVCAEERRVNFVDKKGCASPLVLSDFDEEVTVIEEPLGIKQTLKEKESMELAQTQITVTDSHSEEIVVDEITVVNEVKSVLSIEDIGSDEEHKEEAVVEIFIKENGEAFSKCGGHIETLDPVHGEVPGSLLDETGIDTIIVEEKGEEHIDVLVSALETEKNECMTSASSLDPKPKDLCTSDSVMDVFHMDGTEDPGLDTTAGISDVLKDKSSLGKVEDSSTNGPTKFVRVVETDDVTLQEKNKEEDHGNEHQAEELQVEEVVIDSRSKNMEDEIVDVVNISPSDALKEESIADENWEEDEEDDDDDDDEEEEVTITGVCEPDSAKDGSGTEAKGVEATSTVITGLSNCSRSLQSGILACAAVSASKTHFKAIETAKHSCAAESELSIMRNNGGHLPPALTGGRCQSPLVWQRDEQQDCRREKGKIFLGFLPGESQRDRQLRLASVRVGKSVDDTSKKEDMVLPFLNPNNELEEDCVSMHIAESQVATKSESTAARDHVTLELPVLEQALGSDGSRQCSSDSCLPEEPLVVLPSDYFETRPYRTSRRRDCRGRKFRPRGRCRSHVKASQREKKDLRSGLHAEETRNSLPRPSIIQSPDRALAKTLQDRNVEAFDRCLSGYDDHVDEVSSSTILIISECSETSSEDAFLYPDDQPLSDSRTYELIVCDEDDSLGRSDDWYVEDQTLEQANESEILERVEEVKRQFRHEYAFMETRERTKLKKDLAGLMLKIGVNSNTVLGIKDGHCPSELRDVLESTRGCNVNLLYEIQKLERQREHARERTRRKRRNMSEEAKAVNRSKERERVKLKRAVMSDQQKCVYRARERERARLKRALMSQDKREEERRKSRERMRDFRESLTEEEKLARREMCRVRMRQYRERLYADPDKAIELKKKNRDRQRQSRLQKKVNDFEGRGIDEDFASYAHVLGAGTAGTSISAAL